MRLLEDVTTRKQEIAACVLVEEIPNVSRFIHFVTNIYQLGVYGKHVETKAVDECSIVSITEQIKTVVSS